MSSGGRCSGPLSSLGSRRPRTRDACRTRIPPGSSRAVWTPAVFAVSARSSAICRTRRRLDDLLVNTGLAYLLSFAWRAFLDSDDVVEGVDLHPAVETVARMLRTDPDAGDLAALARAARLSPSHLSRIFKAQTGVSISRFRNQQRLQRFLRLYGSGRRTTALAAALEAGFGSYAQFHRVFREQTGRSPSALRAASSAGRRRG